MTSKILLLSIITFFTVFIASARAKIPVCFPCERLETVKELPADSEIQKMTDQKVNIAYITDEYGLLWLSAWNANGRYVLSDVSNTTYFEIDDEIAQILKEKHDFDINTAENPLSFMKKIGGKLIFIVLIVLIIWGNMGSSKNEVEPTNV